MSGDFGNLSGFIEIMFNSRKGNSYMPGGGCCNNSFGNIWGGNYGTMMPFANTYNPFGLNNFEYSNFGSMYMPQFGGCNPYGGSQFGGYGEFNNCGSQFGAYAQFGGSDYGCERNNNGFGKLLGYLGVGLLGYGIGQSEGNTLGDKVSNFFNKLFGNKTEKDSVPKIEGAAPKQEASSGSNAEKAKANEAQINKTDKDAEKAKVNETQKAQADKTKAEASTDAEKAKKQAEGNTDNISKQKSTAAKQTEITTEIKKAVTETEEEKKLKADAQIKALCLVSVDRDKSKINSTRLTPVPATVYDKTHLGLKGYQALDTVTTIENNDGSSVTYIDEDGDKETGFENGWDRIVRLAKDGSGTIEAKGLDINEKENSTITKKYDVEKNLLEETVKYNKTGIVEVYSEPNQNNGFNRKTVTNPDGTKEIYVINKNKNAWIKK